MSFTALDVKNLREQTNAGMMDCKKALTESGGDYDKAVEYLREKGLAAAAKKAGRVAADGLVASVIAADGTGAIVEVNSETDFVAMNEEFIAFANGVASVIVKENPSNIEELLEKTYSSEGTVAEVLREKILTIGEKLEIRRFERFDNTTMNVSYTHMGGGIGVLVGLEVSDNLRGNEEIISLGRDIGMQAAAMRPRWLDRTEITDEILAKEKEILLAQTINEGKPEAVAEKIVAGRINKFYEENCLVDQSFVKENKSSVSEYASAKAVALGGTVKVVKFTRFEKGEGIEKAEGDFAAEVAKLSK